MRKILIVATFALALPLALSACSDQQLAKTQADISGGATAAQPLLQTACADALSLANIAGLIPGVGAIIPYITAGCATAQGLAKLAADPSSTQWVGQLIGQVKAVAATAGVKLS